MRGLMIKTPFIDQIFDDGKTWEIRGNNTRIRGKIALIRSSSGMIIGTCQLVNSIGPLTLKQIISGRKKHLSSVIGLSLGFGYENPWAWVLTDAKRLPEPIPYKHPRGAVIWVNLENHLQRARIEAN